MKDIEKIARKKLRKRFSPYTEEDQILVRNLENETIFLGYRNLDSNLYKLDKRTNSFELQFEKDRVCYLLFINIENKIRGMGHGWSLYETVHDIARDLDYRVVRQTPSGWTMNRIKTRRDYLLERGYKEYNSVEVEIEL